jgi:hypothetical protein
MKKISLIIAVAVLGGMILMGCKSTPKEAAPAQLVEKTDAYIVIDHKTKAIGEGIPAWVSLFINDGVSAVEKIDAYKGKYVFIGEDSGINLNALRQWSTGFTVNQQMASMVSNRVEARFAGAAVGSPEATYGSYYENVVKAVAAASFSGARRETDFWLQKRYFKADGKTLDREDYTFYVLVSIDKAILDQQITSVINGTAVDPALTREQKTAVDRVKEVFLEDF